MILSIYALVFTRLEQSDFAYMAREGQLWRVKKSDRQFQFQRRLRTVPDRRSQIRRLPRDARGPTAPRSRVCQLAGLSPAGHTVFVRSGYWGRYRRDLGALGE